MPDSRGTTVEIEGCKLTRCYFECPRCLAIKPGADFGLRRMNGAGSQIRNQSHCRLCRADEPISSP